MGTGFYRNTLVNLSTHHSFSSDLVSFGICGFSLTWLIPISCNHHCPDHGHHCHSVAKGRPLVSCICPFDEILKPVTKTYCSLASRFSTTISIFLSLGKQSQL